MVRIPQITSIETAVHIYYAYVNLGNAQIRALFGDLAGETIVKLKNLVREKMDEEHVMRFNASTVDTSIAYRAWGLDIENLEKRLAKLRKYGFNQEAVQ